MKVLRALVIAALFAVAIFVVYRALIRAPHRAAGGRAITVYYVVPENESLAHWSVSLSPKATDIDGMAFYATAQVLAGPPAQTSAIRFPAGTVARSVRVTGSTASVDLGGAVTSPQSGSLAESGEFKALVWTLTALPGISAVQVRIDGARVATLPGGHLEIDEPLTRRSW